MNTLLTMPTSDADEILQSFPDALIWVSPSGFVESTNDACSGLLSADLQGQSWSACIDQYFAPNPDDGHEVSLRDGRLVSLRMLPRAQGGQLIIMSDLTPSRQYQRARAHQSRLAQMGQMTASLAHQIKTPIATAMLYAESIADPELDPISRARHAEKLTDALGGLSRQVQDLLNFSQGSLVMDEHLITTDLIKRWQTESARLLGFNAQWILKMDARELRCAESALTGAFLNLIKNAQQMAEQRDIALQLSIGAQTLNDRLIVRVIDNAGGIGQTPIETLMQPFVSQRRGGTGLGLSVCRGLVQAHGGEMYLKPIENGLCATLELPLI